MLNNPVEVSVVTTMSVRAKWMSGVMVLAVVASVGCGGSGAETASSHETSGGEAAYEGPIASTDVERGAERFETFCGGCHPDGGEDVGPSLIAHPHSAARVRQQIREGSAQMRPFPANRLSDTDMEAVLAYMVTIGAVTQPGGAASDAAAEAPVAE